jgi:hypothetical protein
MGLTTKQRNRLPDSAFLLPSRRAYPMPTKAQARRAGISEAQRLRTLRNALSRSAQDHTGSNYRNAATKARRIAGGAIKTVSHTHGVLHRAGLRRGARRSR